MLLSFLFWHLLTCAWSLLWVTKQHVHVHKRNAYNKRRVKVAYLQKDMSRLAEAKEAFVFILFLLYSVRQRKTHPMSLIFPYANINTTNAIIHAQ